MKNADKPAYAHCMCDPSSGASLIEQGLTKREMFAMAAMQGILAGRNANIEQREYPTEEVSRWAVQQADELLKQLES